MVVLRVNLFLSNVQIDYKLYIKSINLQYTQKSLVGKCNATKKGQNDHNIAGQLANYPKLICCVLIICYEWVEL